MGNCCGLNLGQCLQLLLRRVLCAAASLLIRCLSESKSAASLLGTRRVCHRASAAGKGVDEGGAGTVHCRDLLSLLHLPLAAALLPQTVLVFIF